MDTTMQPNMSQTDAPVPPVQTPQVPPAGQPQQMPPSKNRKPLIITVGIIVLLLIAAVAYRQIAMQPKDDESPAPTPTATVTPTPIREFSGIANDPAFKELESDVASLSAGLRNYNIQDPSLSPPTLILDLGFPD